MTFLDNLPRAAFLCWLCLRGTGVQGRGRKRPAYVCCVKTVIHTYVCTLADA
jgi:hypothetical protein